MGVDRLKILLYNAIVVLQDAGIPANMICIELGMSEEEYKEVMGY
jgi:hypothetical protein